MDRPFVHFCAVCLADGEDEEMKITFEDIFIEVISNIMIGIAIAFFFLMSPIIWLLGLKKK